jgi:hypothetical protein
MEAGARIIGHDPGDELEEIFLAVAIGISRWRPIGGRIKTEAAGPSIVGATSPTDCSGHRNILGGGSGASDADLTGRITRIDRSRDTSVNGGRSHAAIEDREGDGGGKGCSVDPHLILTRGGDQNVAVESLPSRGEGLGRRGLSQGGGEGTQATVHGDGGFGRSHSKAIPVSVNIAKRAKSLNRH